ncbi:D-alanyl-lipoteichoic acid biosynthesis protein DltD [Pseudolactococcus insecticola]|uniref:Protein DltD n=1 Tax=Pseudolactococcus insecticola TaxID=2709158 RepID=A0A6A0B5F2_9LACT|nr:D-alanyl-lipoteichoic acid biosynthesis protein DltD [Lactococcus insecticola]GFH39761.1 D-alanyl-lipoteichoic acid biosynthesis protein DltD [Lactococcus insecticola]
MLKRLWLIFGPILVAVVMILAVILLSPISHKKHDLFEEKRAAVASSAIVFKNAGLKNQALSDPNHRFVPFFGSSEWQRFDEMHPSVLAAAYHRDYTPFLLGMKGTESLTQYFGMQQIKPQLKNKQAVFVVSPQWFVKEGQMPQAFEHYYAGDQAYEFLMTQTGSKAEQYAAKRFLAMMPESPMTKMMKKVAKSEKLSTLDRNELKFLKHLSQREDNIFDGLQIKDNYSKKVLPKTQKLPQKYDIDVLSQKASALGKAHTKNNPYGILDKFYTKRVAGQLAELKESQKDYDYLKSPEYGDFQLVLDEFAKENTSVMFVIPPVNQKWQNYTGLSQEMYEKTVAKIKYQLTSQGFNRIADLSECGGNPYFMQDTIHLGWNGWLAFDQAVAPFLTQKQTQPSYEINNHFLSQTWANQTDIYR